MVAAGVCEEVNGALHFVSGLAYRARSSTQNGSRMTSACAIVLACSLLRLRDSPSKQLWNTSRYRGMRWSTWRQRVMMGGGGGTELQLCFTPSVAFKISTLTPLS